MNKSKIHDSDIIDPIFDYFREFNWENWKWLKQYYSWEEVYIVGFLRVEGINNDIIKSVMDRY